MEQILDHLDEDQKPDISSVLVKYAIAFFALSIFKHILIKHVVGATFLNMQTGGMVLAVALLFILAANLVYFFTTAIIQTLPNVLLIKLSFIIGAYAYISQVIVNLATKLISLELLVFLPSVLMDALPSSIFWAIVAYGIGAQHQGTSPIGAAIAMAIYFLAAYYS